MSHDNFEDQDNLPAPPQNYPDRPNRKRDPEKVGVVGAIIGSGFNIAFMALIMALPAMGLSFITPVFATILLPLLAGPAANIMSLFMRMSYAGHFTKHMGKLLESAAAAWGFYSIWQHYPFAFTSLGVPPFVDRWLPLVCAVFAVLSAIGGFTHFIRMFSGEHKSRRQRRLEETDQDD